MKELALTNLYKTIGAIADSVMDYTELPEELKRRDKLEPGRLRKMAYEEKIVRILKKRWRKQKDKINQSLSLWYPTRKAVIPPVLPPGMTPTDLADNETENDLMITLISAFNHGVQLFEDAMLIGMDYTSVNTGAIEWAKKYVFDLIKGIDETTVKTLQTALASFVSTPGMTIGDVVNMLPFDDQRALKIATTEITRVYSEANIQAGQEMQSQFPGVRVVKTWFTNNDERVCLICEPLNGVEVDIDQEFGDGIDEPPAHPGCRCWISTRTKING